MRTKTRKGLPGFLVVAAEIGATDPTRRVWIRYNKEEI
jgi:hypothetical protein